MVKRLRNAACMAVLAMFLSGMTAVHAEDERDAAFPDLSASMSKDMPDDPVYWMLLDRKSVV